MSERVSERASSELMHMCLLTMGLSSRKILEKLQSGLKERETEKQESKASGSLGSYFRSREVEAVQFLTQFPGKQYQILPTVRASLTVTLICLNEVTVRNVQSNGPFQY